MGFIRSLYRMARTANTINTLASGNPKRIARRSKNIAIGKSLTKIGVFRSLWK